MTKPYYRTCPLCGSNLDPGESCDCTGADDDPEALNGEYETDY